MKLQNLLVSMILLSHFTSQRFKLKKVLIFEKDLTPLKGVQSEMIFLQLPKSSEKNPLSKCVSKEGGCL